MSPGPRSAPEPSAAHGATGAAAAPPVPIAPAGADSAPRGVDSPLATDSPLRWYQRAALALPSRLPLVLFWAVLVACVTIIASTFRPLVVLPALVLAVAATWRLRPDPVPASADQVRGAMVAVSLVVGWVLVNMLWAGEVLLVQRDPGFLALEGVWLTDHPDPAVPVGSAADVAAQVPGVRLLSDAFWLFGDELHAQGAKAFPGLLAMAGWLAGVRGVLVANVLIGGIALLAVYDVARRLIGPRWGLVPLGALALTTPMIYFSRATFTEPTNLALTFGGLAVLWGAHRRPQLWRFALGGAMVGATALTRIDGAAVSAGMIVGMGVVAAVSEPPQRRPRVLGLLVAAAMALGMVGLGYLDLRVNSAGYLEDHQGLYVQLLGLLVACLVATFLLVGLLRWRALRAWLVAHRAGLGVTGAALVVLGAVVLASRPLWMQSNLIEPGTGQEWFIAAAQRAAGVAVDGTRSYDESTVTWLLWYLGPVTLLLAVAGAALLVRRAIVGWHPEVVVLLGTLVVPSLLYLLRPAITPDHIWAMRRMLPAVIPAVLLFAGWTLPGIWRASLARWERVGAWVLVASMLLAPMVTWGSLVVTTEYGGRAEQVAQVCRAVSGQRVVVVREVGPPWLPTLRIMCDVDVVEVGPGTSAEQLASIREVWGPDVLVLTDAAELLPWAGDQPEPWSSRSMARWPHSLFPSYSPIRFRTDLWIGSIAADGTVTAVPAGVE